MLCEILVSNISFQLLFWAPVTFFLIKVTSEFIISNIKSSRELQALKKAYWMKCHMSSLTYLWSSLRASKMNDIHLLQSRWIMCCSQHAWNLWQVQKLQITLLSITLYQSTIKLLLEQCSMLDCLHGMYHLIPILLNHV